MVRVLVGCCGSGSGWTHVFGSKVGVKIGIATATATAAQVSILHKTDNRDPLKILDLSSLLFSSGNLRFFVHGLICKILVAPPCLAADDPAETPSERESGGVLPLTCPTFVRSFVRSSILFLPSVNFVIVAYCTTICKRWSAVATPHSLDVLLNGHLLAGHDQTEIGRSLSGTGRKTVQDGQVLRECFFLRVRSPLEFHLRSHLNCGVLCFGITLPADLEQAFANDFSYQWPAVTLAYFLRYPK